MCVKNDFHHRGGLMVSAVTTDWRIKLQRESQTPLCSNIAPLLIKRVVPGSVKSLATFNHFGIMLSMWIQCVPPLQAEPIDSHARCCLRGTLPRAQGSESLQKIGRILRQYPENLQPQTLKIDMLCDYD